MESGWCTLHCMQALFRAVAITGVVVRGFRSSSVPVTHEGYLVESRRPLRFGPHKPIALSLTTLSRHSPLATASRSTSIISLCLGSSASLSSQANRSVFSTLSRHSPLATVSRSTSIISLCLGSSASLSSPGFQVPVTLVPLFSLSVLLRLLVLSLEQQCQWLQAMWKYCIAHKWGRMYIYTEYARTKHIYIYIYI